MKEVALYEAKNKLSALLDEVATGKEIIITRRGKAAARLTPVKPGFDRAKARLAAEMLLEVSKDATLGGLSIKELINEGRRS